MARSPDAERDCPLYNRRIYWSECVEVQEVREDEMSMSLLYEPFDMETANTTCEKCRWHHVGEWE